MKIGRLFWVWMTLLLISWKTTFSQETWDGESGPADVRWSVNGNWLDNSAPANPYEGVLWFNNSGLGTNLLDQDWSVNSLYYTNSSPIGSHTTDLGGYVLTVSNGPLCVGYNSSNTVVTLRNGTLRLGTVATAADLYAGWAQNNEVGLTGVSLTISCAIDAVNLRKLEVSKMDEVGWPYSQPGCVSEMDLSGATLTSQGVTNKLKTSGPLSVSGYGNQASGTLKLPSAVTNIEVGGLHLGCSVNSVGVLDLGAGSQLRSFSITGDLVMGERGLGEIRNIPTNGVRFTVGSPATPVALTLGRGRDTWAVEVCEAFGRLSLTNALFSAYVNELRVGDRLTFETTIANGELDLKDSSLSTFTVSGDAHIGYSTSVRDNWTYRYSKGYLRLPAGSMNIASNLYIGDVKSSDEGLVEMHGSLLTVGESIHILAYGDAKVWLEGNSAGFDLASSDSNDFSVASGAKMEVVVACNPGPLAVDYWCLRMLGDQVSYFQSLTNSGRVTLDLAALSPSFRNRFAIDYNGTDTVLGIRRISAGTIILIL